jgi:hypothetical protein
MMIDNALVEKQWKWSDKFIPHIKQILSKHFRIGLEAIKVSPLQEDWRHNSDITILEIGNIAISCHVRSYQYYKPFGHQVCVRSRYKNGTKTEIDKIRNGWGDYMLYAFAQPTGSRLYAWTLGDLGALRRHILYEMKANGRLPGQEFANDDGVSYGRAFNLDDMPNGYVVAQHNVMAVM